ncbi:family 43 glycosylhydrolase [Kibdelosporangium aridum]|uniref:Carbohydrate binding module (Family 35) n=1 Tax=Kibdelosporangium aridum TaxID=2030 RepID=A0A1Y5XZA4_KIBAR|nr:family 43 glycosylhydrolase [Kibdelosporangium aridum]SMD22383.1 Carbohydrate binding module (family 35) [Kibdelosporangium aridum]
MRTFLLGLAFSLLLGSVTITAATAATVSPIAVINENFADPDVLHADGSFFAYSTSSPRGRVPVASAPSPTGPWTMRGDALPGKPAWAADGGFWAPDVSRRADGRYLMYFSAPNAAAGGRMCIGAATSTSPTGPFEADSNPLVCRTDEGGQIDPAAFLDSDGARYLLYKNEGKDVGKPMNIWLQQTAADGIAFTGERTELIRADQPHEAGVVEAPTLIRRGSQYVLFYSAGSFAGSDYFTNYAVSPTLRGKYTKASKALLTTTALNGAVQGPGGADAHTDQIFFHGWVNGARWMYTAEMGWANDFPVVRGSRVRYEAEHGTINHAEIRSGVPGASQSAVVGKIDHADSWVDITVYAPRAGGYTAHVSYAAGYGDAEHTVTVNATTQFVLTYPNRGWGNWTETTAELNLNAGWNTMRFQHRSRWAELDHIDLS